MYRLELSAAEFDALRAANHQAIAAASLAADNVRLPAERRAAEMDRAERLYRVALKLAEADAATVRQEAA